MEDSVLGQPLERPIPQLAELYMAVSEGREGREGSNGKPGSLSCVLVSRSISQTSDSSRRCTLTKDDK